MAPEVFLHKTYDKSVDVFSFAIIVHEVSTAQSGCQFILNRECHYVKRR